MGGDFADPNRIDRSSKLPPAPEIDPVSVAKAERPEAVSDTASTAEIFDIERSVAATDADEKPYGLRVRKDFRLDKYCKLLAEICIELLQLGMFQKHLSKHCQNKRKTR